jgi:D-inositol-3-phosphate glycosyltransferase
LQRRAWRHGDCNPVRKGARLARTAYRKVALISAHASPLASAGGCDSGGLNVYVANLARELGRAGHQVDVLTRRDDLWMPPVLELSPNATVVRLPAGPPRFVCPEAMLTHMEDFAARAVRYCGSQGGAYDIAHANFFLSGPAAIRLQERCGTPFVVGLHGLGKLRREGDAFPSERVPVEVHLVASAARVIAGSLQERDALVRLYGAAAGRIEVVPSGFDPSELGPGARNARSRLGLRDDEFVVLHVGRVAAAEGIDDLVRGIARLKHHYAITARLLVVGGESGAPDPQRTPEIARLREIAAAEGIAAQLTFAGRRPRAALRECYCAADAFATTPRHESFGITPIEAMACGVPVVGTAVGGITQAVVDAVTGYLVRPNDPAAVAERLARFHRNPELARAFGRAGILRMRGRFTWRHRAAELARIYAAALAPQRSRLATVVRGR